MTRALVLAVLAAGCGTTPRVRVAAAGSASPVLDVAVELATTADARTRGLRGHAPLGAGDGLLIELPAAGTVCIVNDGVTFAIDAVYAGADGRVIAVAADIAAGDPTARCQDGVADVLEVAAGGAARVAPADVMTIER